MAERVVAYLTIFAFLAGAWLWSVDILSSVHALRRSQSAVEQMAEHLCRFVKSQDHYAETEHLACEVDHASGRSN